jgi:uncharacterized protein YueI
MSFIQKDDTVTNNDLVVVNHTTKAMTDACCETLAVAKFDDSHLSKTVLSKDFVQHLRNIKPIVTIADKEVSNRLMLTEISKKTAFAFYIHSQKAMMAAEAEIEEAMKFEALKYDIKEGNTVAMEEANAEIAVLMNASAIKLTVFSALSAEIVEADKEVATGVNEKSPEMAISNFMKNNSLSVAAADAEISKKLSVK